MIDCKQRLATCERDAKSRVAELEAQLIEAEKASTELETGLRVQLEAATQQCSHFESKLKEVDNMQKVMKHCLLL